VVSIGMAVVLRADRPRSAIAAGRRVYRFAFMHQL
jgi:hypothetical protein